MKKLILYAVLFLCFDSLIAQDTVISIKIELEELELKEKQLKHQLDSILLTSTYNDYFFGHRFIYNMKVTEDSVSNYLIEIFYTRPTVPASPNFR